MTDGEQRAALAVVRSLGRAGHTVHVCSRSGRSLAGASRYATAEWRVASALQAPDQFLGDVTRLVQDTNTDTVIPVTEASLLAILPARDALRGVLVPFADVDVFRHISDKETVLEAARQVGIAIPAQHTLRTPADRAADTLRALAYPVVVKPARSVVDTAGGRVTCAVAHAADAAELTRVLDEIPPEAYPLLVQQRIVGPGVGVFALPWDGELVAAFSHRRLREKPPAGGISVYRESTPLDPSLLQKSRALLDAFGWRGVAMVEYKVDAQTGIPYLMEINGRFWGSLQLAIDAGVDFPALLLAAAAGERPAPVTTYRTDVRSRWWWGDVDHVLTRMHRSDRDLALPPGAPSRWAMLCDFLTRDPRDRDEICQPGDRRPFLRETMQRFVGGA